MIKLPALSRKNAKLMLLSLATTAVMQFIGYLIIRKMVRLKV